MTMTMRRVELTMVEEVNPNIRRLNIM